MSTFQLLCAELRHRKMNVTLSLLALIAAATLFVASPTLLRGYQQESNRRLLEMQQETDHELQAMQEKAQSDLAELDTRTKRIMRDLGFNLRIVHQNTDLGQLYANFVSFDMPEEYVQKLADSPEITKIVHLVASLKQMVEWEGEAPLAGRHCAGSNPVARREESSDGPASETGHGLPRATRGRRARDRRQGRDSRQAIRDRAYLARTRPRR